MATLSELTQLLREGQKLSMQGSYARRAPAEQAVPFLRQARDGLEVLTKANPDRADVWRALSQAHESLLDYSNASQCLQTAMRLEGRRDKRDLKRLAMLRESGGAWHELRLTPSQLAGLGEYLRRALDAADGSQNLKLTKLWLENEGVEDPNATLDALRSRGGYTDEQVLSNVVRG